MPPKPKPKKMNARDKEMFIKHGFLPPSLPGDDFHENYESLDFMKQPEAQFMERLDYMPDAIRLLQKSGGNPTDDDWRSVVPTYGGIELLTDGEEKYQRCNSLW
jgi:hypothetical protein